MTRNVCATDVGAQSHHLWIATNSGHVWTSPSSLSGSVSFRAIHSFLWAVLHHGSIVPVMLKPSLRCLVRRFTGNVVCKWSVPVQQSNEASCLVFCCGLKCWKVAVFWCFKLEFLIGTSTSFVWWLEVSLLLRSANIGTGPFTTTTSTSSSTTTSVASNELPLGSRGTMVRLTILCAFVSISDARSSHWNQCTHVCRGQWW